MDVLLVHIITMVLVAAMETVAAGVNVRGKTHLKMALVAKLTHSGLNMNAWDRGLRRKRVSFYN